MGLPKLTKTHSGQSLDIQSDDTVLFDGSTEVFSSDDETSDKTWIPKLSTEDQYPSAYINQQRQWVQELGGSSTCTSGHCVPTTDSCGDIFSCDQDGCEGQLEVASTEVTYCAGGTKVNCQCVPVVGKTCPKEVPSCDTNGCNGHVLEIFDNQYGAAVCRNN